MRTVDIKVSVFLTFVPLVLENVNRSPANQKATQRRANELMLVATVITIGIIRTNCPYTANVKHTSPAEKLMTEATRKNRGVLEIHIDTHQGTHDRGER